MRRIGLVALFLFISIFLILVLAPIGEGAFQPDLTVTELRVLPPYPEPGDRVEIVFAVSNIGRGAVTQSFDIRLKLDGMTIFRWMRPGEVKEYGVEWQAIAGQHQVLVEIDRLNRVREANERNNTASLSLDVRSKGVLYSFTDAAFTLIGTTLGRTGEMLKLKLDLSGDPFAALGAAVAQLTTAQEILADHGLQLEYADYGVPRALAGATVFVQAERIGEVFTAMATTIGELAAALKGLDLNRAMGVIQRIEDHLKTLAGLGFDGLNLTPLAQAAAHIERAVQLGQVLQTSLFSSSSGGTDQDRKRTEELIQEFQKELAKAGDLIEGVGVQALGLPEKQGVEVKVGAGGGGESPAPVSTGYHSGEPLTVQALGAGVTGLEFTVYGANGTVVSTVRTSGGQLVWSGRDSSGKPLPPGRYFYRAVVHRGEATEEEIGRIIVS